jgi:phage repressor protein C with HTH and peptisase S24 domain
MPIKEILSELMQSHGDNPYGLSRKTGVAQPTIRRIVLGETIEPDHSTVLKLANYYKVTPDELRGLRGFTKQKPGTTLLTMSDVQLERVLSDKVEIPVLANSGSMGYGDAQLGSDVFIGTMTVGKDWAQKNLGPLVTNLDRLAFIHGYGDSMAPTYQDGDILLVDTSVQEPNIDGVYVLSTDEKIFIKRVTRSFDGRHEISSDNPAVKKIDVFNGDHQVQVLGRVVWAWNGRRL